MLNFVSSSQTFISKEVENPSSFNISIPPPDETHSTPACGVGETSAITASRVQTKKAKKRRREGIEPEKPTSTPLPIKSSDTESEDVAAYMTMEREKVRKQVAEKSKPVKGPGPRVQKQSEEKEMTRKERITAMENQKVLNGRIFDLDILTKFGMGNLFDVVSIQGWNHLFEPPVSYLYEPEVR
ncbi:hypothetical protein KY284_033417 [Solanum tuberosum]|nr:hypothetical protein KY284_033417 [Solanum tuberosum]